MVITHGLLNEEVVPEYFSDLIRRMESHVSFIIVKLSIGKDQMEGLVVEEAERQIPSSLMPIGMHGCIAENSIEALKLFGG